MRILVTGGLGYIGSHTVVELQKRGYEVVVIDNLSNSNIAVLYKIEDITEIKPIYHGIDICNKEILNKIFDKYEFDGVIHFASHKYVNESIIKPFDYYHNNVTSLMNLQQIMLERELDNFIFSSSCTVYGKPMTLPVKESAPMLKTFSPYGVTKQMGEQMLEDYATAYNKNIIALRYFNPIGSHESTLIGELPNGTPQNLIPLVTQTAIGIREELSVYGDDYDTPDGTAVRDYIHVMDLANAHIMALERLLNKNNSNRYETFNIGTGEGTSVMQIINTFEEVTKQKLNYKIVDRRIGDVDCIYADTSKATHILEWKPIKTLEDALLSAWVWQLNLK